jgi:Active DUF488-N3 subclade
VLDSKKNKNKSRLPQLTYYRGNGWLPPDNFRAFRGRRFAAEMKQPAARRDLDLLAALSHHANFAISCYCEDEACCHHSILRKLLEARGAAIRSWRFEKAWITHCPGAFF